MFVKKNSNDLDAVTTVLISKLQMIDMFGVILKF